MKQTIRHNHIIKLDLFLKILIIINLLSLIGGLINQYFTNEINLGVALSAYTIMILFPVSFLSSFELAFNKQSLTYIYLILMPLLQFKLQNLPLKAHAINYSGVIYYFAVAIAGALLGWVLAPFVNSKKAG